MTLQYELSQFAQHLQRFLKLHRLEMAIPNSWRVLLLCVGVLCHQGLARDNKYVDPVALEKTPTNKATAIQDEFIITFEHVGGDVSDVIKSLDEKPSFQIKRYSLLGDTLFVTVKGKLENVLRMRSKPGVSNTESNYVIRASDNNNTDGNITNTVCFKPNVELWGLARTSQREKLSCTSYYSYGNMDNGTGVTVYVVDTGILLSHREFEGRARWGYTAPEMDGDQDLNGHGTHVAGIIGAATYGIAKGVSLVAVKVLDKDGSGKIDGLINAFTWILNDVRFNSRTKTLINLSLGVPGISTSLDGAVNEMIRNGIPVIAAAGNDYADACYLSPARVPDAITVGAINRFDYVTVFSNWGRCLDLFAPGHDILSTYIGGVDAVRFVNGTSQAAPHVSGIVARYLSTTNQTTSPSDVSYWITNMATKGAITYENIYEESTPNRLLYMNCILDEDWECDSGALMLHFTLWTFLPLLIKYVF